MSEEKNGNGDGKNLFQNITHVKKRKMLLAFALEVWTIFQAAAVAECEPRSHYNWLKDPDYAIAWKTAEEMRGNRLEDIAYARATQEKSASDLLTIFLLKGQKPDKYRERVSSEISGPGGGPVQIHAEITQMTDEELDEELQRLKKED